MDKTLAAKQTKQHIKETLCFVPYPIQSIAQIYPSKKTCWHLFENHARWFVVETKTHKEKQMQNQKLSPTPYQDELEKDVVALILKLQQQSVD